MTFIYKHFTIKALRFYICAEYNLGQLKCTLPPPGWLFLTGQPEDIELLRRKPGFTDPDPELDKDKSSHIGNVRYDKRSAPIVGCMPRSGRRAMDHRIDLLGGLAKEERLKFRRRVSW